MAEIGTDMTRFPGAKHLASWAGLCPGNHESAGKRRGGATRKGSPWLRACLVQAAHAAARTKGTYRAAQYRRLATRRGRAKAAIAVAHSILIIAYHVLTEGDRLLRPGRQLLRRARSSGGGTSPRASPARFGLHRVLATSGLAIGRSILFSDQAEKIGGAQTTSVVETKPREPRNRFPELGSWLLTLSRAAGRSSLDAAGTNVGGDMAT